MRTAYCASVYRVRKANGNASPRRSLDNDRFSVIDPRPPHDPNMPLKILFAFAAAFLSTACPAEIVVNDATGATIRLDAPARRIVTLAPHLAETLFAAGAGKWLVGVVEYSNYPEEARRIPSVGSYSHFDLEAIAALKPDLIVAWESGNSPAHLEKLRKLGFTVFVSQPDRIEDIPLELRRLGALAGVSAIADAQAARLEARLHALRTRYSALPRVRTFYQIWQQPLTTIGGKQVISTVIRLCGGENVFESLEPLAANVTVESVIAANPEVIIASGMDKSRPEWLDDWRRWTSIAAVPRDNLFFIDPDLMQRHTPRLLDGAEQLCEHLETARARRPR
jgi:iron complex transport system substrate-binding protein